MDVTNAEIAKKLTQVAATLRQAADEATALAAALATRSDDAPGDSESAAVYDRLGDLQHLITRAIQGPIATLL
jgi:hypothetical protein